MRYFLAFRNPITDNSTGDNYFISINTGQHIFSLKLYNLINLISLCQSRKLLINSIITVGHDTVLLEEGALKDGWMIYLLTSVLALVILFICYIVHFKISIR